MGLLRERCAEWKKVRLQCCCSQVWMKNAGQIPWNAFPICETFKISCLMGRLHTKGVLEDLFKGPIVPFGSLVEYRPITAKDQSRIHQFGKKVLPGLFLGYALYAGGIWKGDVLVADLEELETMDASEIYPKRLNAKEATFPKEKGKIFFRSQMDESTPLEGIKTWKHPPCYGSRRVSSTTSRLVSGCQWSDKWFLVHVRKLHKPPSRWTQSKTLLAERRVILYSTEVHWRFQNYTYESGCQARETHRWLLEYRWVTSLSEKNFTAFKLKNFNDEINSFFMNSYCSKIWNYVKLMRKASVKWEELKKFQSSTFDTIARIRNSKKPSRTRVRNWKRQLLLLCRVKLWKIVGTDLTSTQQNLRVFWKLMNPPECVWENHYQSIMKSILQEKETIHYSITIWFTNLFVCLMLWKFQQQKQQWTRNGKNWRKFRRGTWPKSKVRNRWSMKQGRRAQKFIFLH